ncbi:toll/interleukin-1 receptor domain-containing protein [Acinetobacter sp. ANC 4282]|uniref:toll/interleukin-1 receptor domain-containing protein n=1 Tax=Acinetobacter terrae TaxID=2731247 RepID=UPI00148F85A8|nr:toll/interleukin-1 receptor domain-containing protein [Acinetobacter terrae]NNH16707.1 toll/interleukin-1 receptor domain-containing protein [Acinetobacter terrae]
MSKIPRVFISYSHDSLEHKQWVLELSTRLRTNGVDAVLDQWELRPGDDLPKFMEINLAQADRVLMICTDNYVAKANNGTGGVGYEKMIVTSELLSHIDSNKVIPIIRQESTCITPTFLRTKLFINFSNQDQYEFAFDDLIRAIHGAPLFEKPPISKNPFLKTKQNLPNKTIDPHILVMKEIVRGLEKTSREYVDFVSLMSSVEISRILLDHYLDELKEERLIVQNVLGAVKLTPNGRRYAINQNLIS